MTNDRRAHKNNKDIEWKKKKTESEGQRQLPRKQVNGVGQGKGRIKVIKSWGQG